MTVTGLHEKQSLIQDTDLLFFKYVKNQYTMTSNDPLRLLGIIPTTSMIYPIAITKVLCAIGNNKIFDTEILSTVYAIVYLTALFLCLKWLNFNKLLTMITSATICLIILLDGNYLVWFNSLYGEPMMIIGLLLFIASILNVSNKLGSVNLKDILFVAMSSFLFLGSKVQCITSLPLLIFMIVRCYSFKYRKSSNMEHHYPPIGNESKNASITKTIRINGKSAFCVNYKPALFITIGLIIFYTLGIYLQVNSTCGVDTKYNSVFYGILKNSDNPERDLEMLDLPKDMSVEAGKHAYLPKDEYIKYAPWSDITQREFNDKISNTKIIKFYILNPDRLIEGMKYTASQSFQTSSFLGKYKNSDVSEYTYLFKRFTIWSDIRDKLFPKRLWFITLFYAAIFITSFKKYTRANNILNHSTAIQNDSAKLRIELIWLIAMIGIFQFPMPYLGNGEADTAKQLFLFNYTFDILVLVSIYYVLSHLPDFFKDLKNKRTEKNY